MTNIGNKIMNKKISLGVLVIALVFSVFPISAQAFNPLDPFGIFEPDQPTVVNNTNSNNVNSNVNSPGATITNNNSPVGNTGAGVIVPPVIVYDNNYPTYPNNPPYQGQLSASCYVDPVYTRTNTTVTWRATASGGTGNYSYSWSGTDGLSSSGSYAYRSYSYPGIKSASVRITSGGQSISISCNNTVTVDGYYNDYNGPYYNNNNYYDYNYNSYNGSYYDNGPLSVSCSPSVTFAQVGEYVTWNASVTGGTGYYTYSWAGNDDIRGSDRVVNVRYNATGPKSASVTVRSNGRIITQSCGYVTIGIRNDSYYPGGTSGALGVSCYPDKTNVSPSTPITWTANPTGGNGVYSYAWTGTDGLGGSQRVVATAYPDTGTKSATVTVTSGGQSTSASCSSVRVAYSQSTYRPSTPTQTTAKPAPEQSASAFFALNNVPWGAVAIIVIFVLFGTVMYLLFNKSKI